MLSHVASRERHKGHATGLLKKVVAYADKHDLEVFLTVQAYGHPTQTILSNEDLVRFYSQFGFVATSTNRGIRAPMTRYRAQDRRPE